MTRIPRIRSFLPGGLSALPPRLPAPSRAGEAPEIFRRFGRTLDRLERAAHTRAPGEGGGA
ncbi:hypothetical protein [Ancylobacter lacus]|uniref:hypothetical protein n=1 Tax=Ancylobacter lacus TaxID=2579970 RepID=UPI001BD069F6|nr:hypothetical protein [Ancylobacter lacus]MBS7539374.1 hypothetical protein [Ancylobacter lacus]